MQNSLSHGGMQSAAEFHDRPLAHFDFGGGYSANKSDSAISQSSSDPSQSGNEFMVQLVLALEISAVVVLLMLFLDRLHLFNKDQKQRSIVERLEKLQVIFL